MIFLFLVPNLFFFTKDFKKDFDQVGGEGQNFYFGLGIG